jgi:hypothetical protein
MITPEVKKAMEECRFYQGPILPDALLASEAENVELRGLLSDAHYELRYVEDSESLMKRIETALTPKG